MKELEMLLATYNKEARTVPNDVVPEDITNCMATNIANMWKGPLCYDVLKLLVRLLLRFQLAPLREAAYRRIVLEKATEKSDNRSHSEGVQTKYKAWKRKCRLLQEDLATCNEKRRRSLMGLLLKHAQNVPKRSESASVEDSSSKIEDLVTVKAMEAMEEAEETEQTAVGGNGKTKETTAKVINMLAYKIIYLMRSEEYVTIKKITHKHVQALLYKTFETTTRERQVAADIVNKLRPFCATYKTPAHPLYLAPMVFIANAVFRLAGYAERALTPMSSPGNNNALLINAKSLYSLTTSVSCTAKYQVPLGDGHITSLAGSHAEKCYFHRFF